MAVEDIVLTPTGLRYLGRRFACTIGRGGLSGDKREGDGATPRGRHHIVEMLYRPDRIPPPAPWARPIGAFDLWCDAPEDGHYNHRVRAPFAASHERLRRADPQYDLILVTDWNYPQAMPGRGSAIFVHQWRRPFAPTAGCIALPRRALHWIARRIAPGTPLVVT